MGIILCTSFCSLSSIHAVSACVPSFDQASLSSYSSSRGSGSFHCRFFSQKVALVSRLASLAGSSAARRLHLPSSSLASASDRDSLSVSLCVGCVPRRSITRLHFHSHSLSAAIHAHTVHRVLPTPSTLGVMSLSSPSLPLFLFLFFSLKLSPDALAHLHL